MVATRSRDYTNNPKKSKKVKKRIKPILVSRTNIIRLPLPNSTWTQTYLLNCYMGDNRCLEKDGCTCESTDFILDLHGKDLYSKDFKGSLSRYKLYYTLRGITNISMSEFSDLSYDEQHNLVSLKMSKCLRVSER